MLSLGSTAPHSLSLNLLMNHPHRAVTKSGSFNPSTRTVDWSLGTTATSADANFTLSGTANVTSTNGIFWDLDITSSGAGDACSFTNAACAVYNAGQQAAMSASCTYACTLSSPSAASSRTVTVTAKDKNNAVKQTQSTTVTFTASAETGKTATVTDPYLQSKSDFVSSTVTASASPTAASWIKSTPVSCAECSAGVVASTATVTSSDAKTATAAFIAPVSCTCSVAVAVSGAGSYSLAWTW